MTEGFSSVTVETTVHILPSRCNSPEQVVEGVKNLLNGTLMKFNTQLQGIVMGYKSLDILDTHGQIFLERPHVHFNIRVTLLVFKPAVGDYLVGYVNKVENDHVGVLVHGIFNSTISAANGIPADFEYETDDNVFLNETTQQKIALGTRLRVKMHRFFGKKKEEAPTPTLDDVSSNIGKNMAGTEQKIAVLDKELANLKQQIARARPGAQKESLKRRAVMLLKQKKQYEGHRDAMFGQQMNIETTNFMHNSIKDTADHVKAMKASHAVLSTQMKQLDLDEIEDMQYDMEDLMMDHQEMQEIMSRQLGVPDYVDEDELLGELDTMFDEVEEMDEVPNYLINANTAQKDAQRQTDTQAEPTYQHQNVNNIQI